MKRVIVLLLLVLVSVGLIAQDKKQHLLGTFGRDELLKEPYSTWFVKNYDEYTPDAEKIAELKSVRPNDYTIKMFIGTWCGDTKRELPRILKILDAIGFNPKSIQLIGLSNVPETYKQSPGGEDKGLSIYRVPTFVVYKKGVEVNRIVEYAAVSLEHDLLSIFSGMEYTPNYSVYDNITLWDNQGLLDNATVQPLGLANQIRHKVNSFSELGACTTLFLYRGEIAKGITIAQINRYLHPDNSLSYFRLGMAYRENKAYKTAIGLFETAIEKDVYRMYTEDYLKAYQETVRLDCQTK